MFWTPKPSIIESDDGFAVEYLGRAGLSYSEEGKSLLINSELLLGPYLMVIYKRSIQRWDPPYSDQIIDEADRERIINNIRAAYRSQGQEIDVE